MKLGPWVEIYILRPDKKDRWNRYLIGFPYDFDQYVSPYLEMRIWRWLFVFGKLDVRLKPVRSPKFKAEAVKYMEKNKP